MYVYAYIVINKGNSRRFSAIFCSVRFVLAKQTRVCAYIHIIRISIYIYTRALEGKLLPRYVRCREHAEEDLQPRKLYYSGPLAPAVEK